MAERRGTAGVRVPAVTVLELVGLLKGVGE